MVINSIMFDMLGRSNAEDCIEFLYQKLQGLDKREEPDFWGTYPKRKKPLYNWIANPLDKDNMIYLFKRFKDAFLFSVLRCNTQL
jgi:hypothetical protein